MTNTPINSSLINKKTVKFNSLDNLNRNLEFDDDTEEKTLKKRLEIVHEDDELLVHASDIKSFSKPEIVMQTGFKTATGRSLTVEKVHFQSAVVQFETNYDSIKDGTSGKSANHAIETMSKSKSFTEDNSIATNVIFLLKKLRFLYLSYVIFTLI